MKKYLLIIILFSLFTSLYCQEQTLKEYANKEDITTIVLSKNMLSLFPKNTDLTYGGVDVGDFLEKLSNINMFVSPKENQTSKLIQYATGLMKTPGYEKLMNIKTDKNEDVDLFIRGNEKQITELILIVQDKSKKSAVIQFIGDFTIQDIQQMVAKSSE